MDSKFPVTDKALLTIKQVMDVQDAYGFAKYGKELDPKDKYDWMEMFLQEIADGIKYIQCEMDRKKEIIQILSLGMRSDEPKLFIELALDLLTIQGTGKGDADG